jgi:hypothetical protein
MPSSTRSKLPKFASKADIRMPNKPFSLSYNFKNFFCFQCENILRLQRWSGENIPWRARISNVKHVPRWRTSKNIYLLYNFLIPNGVHKMILWYCIKLNEREINHIIKVVFGSLLGVHGMVETMTGRRSLFCF